MYASEKIQELKKVKQIEALWWGSKPRELVANPQPSNLKQESHLFMCGKQGLQGNVQRKSLHSRARRSEANWSPMMKFQTTEIGGKPSTLKSRANCPNEDLTAINQSTGKGDSTKPHKFQEGKQGKENDGTNVYIFTCYLEDPQPKLAPPMTTLYSVFILPSWMNLPQRGGKPIMA